MNKHTRRVLTGFINLDPSERTEFIQEINKYLKLSSEAKKKFEEQIKTEYA